MKDSRISDQIARKLDAAKKEQQRARKREQERRNREQQEEVREIARRNTLFQKAQRNLKSLAKKNKGLKEMVAKAIWHGDTNNHLLGRVYSPGTHIQDGQKRCVLFSMEHGNQGRGMFGDEPEIPIFWRLLLTKGFGLEIDVSSSSVWSAHGLPSYHNELFELPEAVWTAVSEVLASLSRPESAADFLIEKYKKHL